MAEGINIGSMDWKQKFTFSSQQKKSLIIAFGIGLILFIVGAILLANGVGEGHHAHEGGTTEQAHHSWVSRLWANIWINNVFFTGIAIIGVFFIAVKYVARAGWYTVIKRVPESFGAFIPVAGILMLLTFLIGGHDIFHWTHSGLYEEGSQEFDSIINGKAGFFFWPLSPSSHVPFFFLLRMVLYFVLWYALYRILRKFSLREDELKERSNYTYFNKSVVYSAIFLAIFAVSSSTSAWDWVMSIDTHWFSTMFGWYVFASWFVTGLSVMTLMTIILYERGYLPMLKASHLHDLGKFMFAFSIFWTYIWFSQFLLIYYANIPEEAIYFKERLHGYGGVYSALPVLNLIINFAFPFLFLMTRDAKRKTIFLKITAIGLIIGHWLDFYLMIMPGVVGAGGGFGLIEMGTIMIYVSIFIYVVTLSLSKANLIPKNHPMLEESLTHTT